MFAASVQILSHRAATFCGDYSVAVGKGTVRCVSRGHTSAHLSKIRTPCYARRPFDMDEATVITVLYTLYLQPFAMDPQVSLLQAALRSTNELKLR